MRFERSFIPLFTDGIYKGHLWSYNDITINIILMEISVSTNEVNNFSISELDYIREVIENMNKIFVD